MKDQATAERSMLVRITRTRCSILLSDDSHFFRMRVVSKVITFPVGVGLDHRMRSAGIGWQCWWQYWWQ